MSILKILEEIGNTPGRNDKIAIIKKNLDNELFLKVVKLALDPYTKFFIKIIPDYESTGTKSLDYGLKDLEKLSLRQLTGSAGIEHLRNILSYLTPSDAIVVERIIGKDLRCGASESSFNAVIPGFISVYPCLLARPGEEKNLKNIVYPAFSELKGDGGRSNFHVSGDDVSICGRSGRPIDLLGEMDEAFIELGKQFPFPVMFDGELVVIDDNGIVLPRRVGNGIINKAIRGTISREEAKMVRVMLWDVIPLSEFYKGKTTEIYKTRFESLEKAITILTTHGEATCANKLKGISPKYWIIPYKIVNSLEEAVAHFELLLSQGFEGTILRNFNNHWSDTRSKDLVKMKGEKEVDLEIIGQNPGKGQFLGQIGSLICASSDRKVQVDISGFTLEERADITKNINNLLGGIVSVRYNERISSKSSGRAGIDSLFLPRFLEHRFDKTTANSSDEIK